jgi:hypothetical protein
VIPGPLGVRPALEPGGARGGTGWISLRLTIDDTTGPLAALAGRPLKLVAEQATDQGCERVPFATIEDARAVAIRLAANPGAASDLRQLQGSDSTDLVPWTAQQLYVGRLKLLAAPRPAASVPPPAAAPPAPASRKSSPSAPVVPKLEVQVIRSDTRAPIAHVAIVAHGPGTHNAVTDQTGWVRFDSVEPGSYGISAILGALEEDYQAPGDPANSASVFAGTVQSQIPLVPRLLHITALDDHFAPQAESLQVAYAIGGLTDKDVKLRIKDREGHVIHERSLTGAEKADGSTKSLQWDGKATAGARSGRHATPLMAPFKVELFGTQKYRDEAAFRILYHSIQLQAGPWTPDELMPPTSNERAWTAWKLNELGYWGGPVGKDFEQYLDKAIVRYKVNHPKLHQLNYSSYNAQITADLKNALAAGEGARTAISGDALTKESGSSRLRLEEITYESGEFGSERVPHESARVNRPLLPLEVTILLAAKDNSAASAPDAVGPVRVNWRFTDANEDLSTQYTSSAAEPSRTSVYLDKALKVESGRAGNGDNCPKDLGGIREAPGTNYRTAFVPGTVYTPYTVEDDSGDKVVFVKAWDDAGSSPKRLGKAGILFRPSLIGGDDYKLRAEIDFKGQANKTELEGFHNVKTTDDRIHAGTGTFTVWRTASIAAVVEWPTRSAPPATHGSHEWQKIADEFEKAFIELDISGIRTLPITAAIDEPTYQGLVASSTSFTDKSKIHLDPQAMIGVALPAQGMSTARVYRQQLSAFCKQQFDALYSPLRREFSKKIRATLPTGFVITTFFVHKAVDIQNAPATGDLTVAPRNLGFITWTSSIGLEDSMILYDMKDPDKPYYVSAHEMGHNFYLLHWENTGESNLLHHDQADHNCLMSYSSGAVGAPAHQAQGVYTPHLCGKCNLKLRGWKVLQAPLPASSA